MFNICEFKHSRRTSQQPATQIWSSGKGMIPRFSPRIHSFPQQPLFGERGALPALSPLAARRRHGCSGKPIRWYVTAWGLQVGGDTGLGEIHPAGWGCVGEVGPTRLHREDSSAVTTGDPCVRASQSPGLGNKKGSISFVVFVRPERTGRFKETPSLPLLMRFFSVGKHCGWS